MPMFRKKPVVIEAWRYPDEKMDIPGLFLETIWSRPLGFDEAPAVNTYKSPCDDHYWIGGAHLHTLEGPLQVSDGDWVIKGIKNEMYPCKPDIFEATYEPVEVSHAE